MNFFSIFITILLPIFLQILIGFVVQKKLQLNIKTLSRVQMYVFIPALIFEKVYSSDLEGSLITQIIGFTIILFIILMILSLVMSKLIKLSRKKEKAFVNSVVLRNQGNFAIPLITMLYMNANNELALSIHMIVLLVTDLLTNTFGIFNSGSGSYTWKGALLKIFKLPLIYAIILGFILRGFHVTVPSPLMSSIEIMSDGLVPLALFTLGAQLVQTRFSVKDISVYISSFFRLLVSPLMAYLLTLVFGISGVMAQVLVIGAAAPTAVNSVLIAIECDGDSEYASLTVFSSTILSAITVSLVISLVFAYM